MKLSEIGTPIQMLKSVGPSNAKLLAKLNLFTVGDLLSFWPRYWEDRTNRVPISEWKNFSKVHTVAKVLGHSFFGYGNMKTLKILVSDGTAQGELVCFNRGFLEKTLPVNSIISLTASFSAKFGTLQSSAFEAKMLKRDGSIKDFENLTLSDSKVFPVYHLTQGLTQAGIRKIIAIALTEYCRGIEDEIPEDVIKRNNLLSKKQAVLSMHQPETMNEALDAKRTLIFEELFMFQTAIGKRSIEHRGKLPDENALQEQLIDAASEKAETKTLTEEAFQKQLSPKQKELISRLPFSLTDDQKYVLFEINADIDKGYSSQNEAVKKIGKDDITKAELDLVTNGNCFSMARLLQGDVGSGKTLVAFLSCLRIIDWGGQCAILAPTELLARQHAENAAKQLEPLGISIAFLTGNIKSKSRKPLLDKLKTGEIDIVIGTHALFSQSVLYKNLKLVIIDEQHRFGVLQRNAIISKGRKPFSPHLLMMSATPIPQTLALTVFGDLDVSIIKTMPKGRKKIMTHLTKQGNESNCYEFVRKELKQNHQAYFVYPLIESSFQENDDGKSLKSSEEMFDFLSKQVYPEYKLALIHSNIDEDEQQKIMDSFKKNEIQILVATSVVEVGVDVPNATCIVIEQAERFGLAALHQLRGRVGRGSDQSHCFLIYANNLTEIGKERLKAIFEETDGFLISEEDLRLRGPGEVLGVQQSGYIALSIADPVKDSKILQIARKEAFDTLRKNLKDSKKS